MQNFFLPDDDRVHISLSRKDSSISYAKGGGGGSYPNTSPFQGKKLKKSSYHDSSSEVASNQFIGI